MTSAIPLLPAMRTAARPVQKALVALFALGIFEAFIVAQQGSSGLKVYGMLIPVLLGTDAIGYALGAAVASVFSRTPSENGRNSVALIGLGFGFCAGLVLMLFACAVVYTIQIAGGEFNHFMVVYASLLPFLLANHVGCALLRATNNAHTFAKILAASTLIHALSLMLFATDWLIPTWGLEGVAYAYFMSTATVSMLLVYKALEREHRLSLSACALAIRPVFYQMWPIAWKSSLSNLMTPIGVMVAMQLLTLQSDAHAVAFTLALKIEMFALVSFYAYSSVIGPLVGCHMREHQGMSLSLLVPCIAQCFKRGLLLAGVLGALQFLITSGLLPCCDDSLHLLQNYLLIVPISYGAYGTVMLTNAVCNGMGHPTIGLFTSFARALGLFVPLALMLSVVLSAFSSGVFIAIALSNLITVAISIGLLHKVASRHRHHSQSQLITL